MATQTTSSETNLAPTEDYDARPTICHLLLQMDYGGAEVLARQYALYQRQDFNVVVACLDTLGTIGRRLQEDGFVVESLERKPGVDFGCARRLREFLRKHRVDIVHAHQFSPYFYASLARGLKTSPAILFHEHGRGWPDYRRWKRVLANRFLLRGRDRVVAVGEQVREALIRNEGLPRERIEVIYNGIDLGRYAEQRNRDDQRRKLGLEENQFIVTHVARLVELKDHATALRAIARCVEVLPTIKYLVVGDGPERPTLETMIHELGIEQQVELLGSRDDVADILAAGDLFLLSSVTEGIPLTVIEAMATGLPCVATDVGGTSEVVIEGKTGLLAPAGDEKALATAILALANDSELRREYGEAGRKRAHDKFDEREMHEAFVRTYREILAANTLPN